MENRFLLDTNIIIYYFNGIVLENEIDDILRNDFNISIITKIEFLSWQKLLKDDTLYKKAKEFISYATIYDLNEVIADQTIKIRQQYKIKIPDAIIGATALTYGLDIVTNNVKDFSSLDLSIKTVELA